MTGIITSTSEIKKVLKNIKNKLSYDEQNLVAEVSTTNAYKEIKLNYVDIFIIKNIKSISFDRISNFFHKLLIKNDVIHS